MDFHDFEKFNGKNIDTFVKILQRGYSTHVVEIDGVQLIANWDFEGTFITYRLPEEGYPYGHQLIGHADENGKGEMIFEASDEEWT